MAPPLPWLVRLPVIVLLETFSVPPDWFEMPPPLPPATPLLTVIPAMLTVTVVDIVKTRTLTPVAGFTISLAAPGPFIETLSVMLGSAEVRLMVQTPSVQNGSDGGIPIEIASVLAVSFAFRMAPRSEHPGLLIPALHAPATTLSDVVLTKIGKMICAF